MFKNDDEIRADIAKRIAEVIKAASLITSFMKTASKKAASTKAKTKADEAAAKQRADFEEAARLARLFDDEAAARLARLSVDEEAAKLAVWKKKKKKKKQHRRRQRRPTEQHDARLRVAMRRHYRLSQRGEAATLSQLTTRSGEG
jgi:ABC-type uncharacterized transport system ATPase component